MKRIQRVQEVLREQCRAISREQIEAGFEGFDTETLAALCGLVRTNTSKELNTLVEQGLAVKVTGRPVRYFDAARIGALRGSDDLPRYSWDALKDVFQTAKPEELQFDEDFNLLVNRRPSWTTAVNQSKAAMMYPPNGLHTLLVGQSGVGKTFFAEAMYRFGCQRKLLKRDAKFVIFNCAEYANNPQLLLSNLFGYTKGAFTGADKDHPGIIDQADGGVLLLDEVHRLPDNGQEMLFTLIDKGYYRRMGESEEKIKVDLRLVCATTEDIDSYLLSTFRRRIPMVIHLPSLSEHSMEEKYMLVSRFFAKEVENIGTAVRVPWSVLAGFLCYHPPGNIGQLRSDIQLTCARAFLEMEMQGAHHDYMEVTEELLPDGVGQGLSALGRQREEVSRIVGFGPGGSTTFTVEGIVPASSDAVNTAMLYQKIRQLYSSYTMRNYGRKDIVQNINQYIKDYIGMPEQPEQSEEIREQERLSILVGKPVYEAAVEALKEAEWRLGRSFSRKVVAAFSLHLSVLLEQIHTRYAGESSLEEVEATRAEHPNEFYAAEEMINTVSRRLGVTIPKQEVVFFSAFLHAVEETESTRGYIGLLVLMHGRSTASSMAEVVNSVLNTSLCQAMDLPLNEPMDRFYERLCGKIKEMDQGEGVLVLVDMGSLAIVTEQAGRETGVEMRCIEMVSTLMVLEATRKCLYREADLDMMFQDLIRTLPMAAAAHYESSELPEGTPTYGGLIVVTCISGLGAARRLCDLIASNVPEVNMFHVDIRPFDKDGSTLTAEDRERAVMVVGAVDLHLGIPYIEVDEIIMNNGFHRVAEILRGDKRLETMASREMPASVLIKMLAQYLNFLDPTKAKLVVEQSFEIIEQLTFLRDARRTKLRYLLHCCCLIERVFLDQQLNYDDVETLRREKGDQFTLCAKALNHIERAFSIKIADTEIAYVVDLINTV